MIDAILMAMYKHRLRGRDRAWSIASSRLLGRTYLKGKNKYGVRLAIDPNDYVDRVVLNEGFYESEVFDAIREAMKGDSVFWDVGSNAGHHAISLASMMPQATIVCFEPSMREVHRIFRSMSTANVQVEVLPVALSDTQQLARFHLCHTNFGRNALETWGDTTEFRQSLASCVRGDTLCFEFGYPVPRVVKIDVEGAEYKVLAGMERILSDDACRRIVFEAGEDVLLSKHPIYATLAKARFSIRRIERNENTAHNLHNFIADKD